MAKKVCENCGKEIDIKKDLYVLLGTYDGDRIVQEKYFHMECWRRYFEERARQKAETVVNGMQERMIPIAKQLTQKLKSEIDRRSENSNAPKIINI